jgi:hypothetical protein
MRWTHDPDGRLGGWIAGALAVLLTVTLLGLYLTGPLNKPAVVADTPSAALTR